MATGWFSRAPLLLVLGLGSWAFTGIPLSAPPLPSDVPSAAVAALPAAEALGEERTFWVRNRLTDNYFQVTAVMRRLTDRGYFYVDTGVGIGDDWLDAMAEEWETVYRKVTALTGDIPDVDGDPHVTVLVTAIPGLEGRGYFGRLNQTPGAAFSNGREMVYFDYRYFGSGGRNKAEMRRLFGGGLAHELQHVVYANYKGAKADHWLNEGIAELVAFRAGYDHGTSGPYLRFNCCEGLLATADPAEEVDYAQGFLFALYLWERYGGDAFIRALVQRPESGVAGVDATLQAWGHTHRFTDVFRNWTIANYMGDRVADGGIYGYRTRRWVEPEIFTEPFFCPSCGVVSSVSDLQRTGNIDHWGVNYYLFRGHGDLTISFDGQDDAPFSVSVVTNTSPTFREGLTQVTHLALNEAQDATTVVHGAGTSYPVVLLVVRSEAGGELLLRRGAPRPRAGYTLSARYSPRAPDAPVLLAPLRQTTRDLGPTLTWNSPPGATQYHLQVSPFNGDGPGIDVQVGAAEASYRIPAPPAWYGLLPDMTYRWRVRTSAATTFVGLDDPSWSPWASSWFRTPYRDARAALLLSPGRDSVVQTHTPLLQWREEFFPVSYKDVFYWEVQLSKDPSFTTDPTTATARVYSNLVHGGVSTPPHSLAVPASAPLEPGTTYYWRVRPRVQGDGMPVGWREPWSFKTLAPGVPTVTPTAPPAPTATATPTRTPVPNRAPVIKAIEVVRYDSLPSQIWYKVDAEDDAVAASQLAWQWTLTAACGEFLYRPDNYYDQIYQFSGCAPAQVAAARITVTVTDAQGARATYSQLARENENKGWVRVG